MPTSPEQLVGEFLREFQVSRTYLRDRITALAEAGVSGEADIAESATRTLFGSLIERLADSFDPEGVSLYNRLFSQLAQIWRSHPRSSFLDLDLGKLGLLSEEDMLSRAESLRSVSKLARDRTEAIQRVLVLSRVTLGADVAITSVILERFKQLLPDVEIFLLAGGKSRELFGGDCRVHIEEIGYRRGGTTIERLLAWGDVLSCVRRLTSDLRRGEYLIVDPDTRLTQLGLLPLTEFNERLTPANLEYLFFPSREYGSDTSLSLAELTCAWLNEVFAETALTHPRISLHQADIEAARKIGSTLRGASGRQVVAINFGIGQNHLKRVTGEFEATVVASLVREGRAVVFDKGAGDEEGKRAGRVLEEVSSIERDGHRVRIIELGERNLADVLSREDLDADVLVWNGRIGMLAALIGESDLYIGYDSAGQHIAAALQVPCIDVFAGSSSPRMLDRWKPTGKAETRVLAINSETRASDSEKLTANVLLTANRLLERAR